MIVSIVIPCYNVEDYLTECLNSVINQTYKNIEIICVDNCSTDKTLLYLNEFKNNCSQTITILSESQKGAPPARNKGLLSSNGEYIQFLDADDLIYPDKIANQINLAVKNDLPDFVAGAYERLFINGTIHKILPDANDVWISLMESKLGITSSNLFKRDSLIHIDGWDVKLNSSQEYDVMFRLMCNKARIVFDQNPLTLVRERSSNSISKLNEKQNILTLIELLVKIKNYLKKNKEEWFLRNSEKVNQIIFDKIRELSKFDFGLAEMALSTNIDAAFIPSASPASTKLYIALYQLLGFKITEKLSRIFKLFKSISFNR